jgi:predicted metal-dependent phosphotriesterase family hydrolase
LGALTLLIVGTAGCGNTKAAEEAIARADRFYAGMQEEATKVLPDAVKRLSDSLQKAKDLLAGGDGTGAQRVAVDAAGEAVRLAKLVPRKRVELDSIYKVVSVEVTHPFRQTVTKIGQISSSGRMPAGVTRASFDSLKKEALTWEDTWKSATAHYQKGELALAASRANEVKSKIIGAMRMLNVR